MGTKNNPGAFDCYTNAVPDEPMFVLLGRDKHAAVLVHLWLIMRARDGESDEKLLDAAKTANDMVEYLQTVKPNVTPAGLRAAALAVAVLAEDVGGVVTIEQVPLLPLAMGHYRHSVRVQPKRVLAT